MLMCKYRVNDGRRMKKLELELQKYLENTLSVKVSIQPWKERNSMPLFLVDNYDFFETFILNSPCLLMLSKDEKELTPNIIQKHLDQVAKKWNAPCIYVSNAITSYNRSRLIQQRVPFIIPNNQIYIPDIGIDLREHFKQQRTHKEIFSPAAQTVIISALLSEKAERLIPSELVAILGYSHMTMTRAFNELESAGIGKFLSKGKERWWIFGDTKRDLWEQTKDMLRSPIRSREWMNFFPGATPQMLTAGLSALAETTMINPPRTHVYAMGVEENRIGLNGLCRSTKDEADLELEIWNYNPKLFSKDGRVDPFSLYLSLRETTDERIEKALEELMEKVKW